MLFNKLYTLRRFNRKQLAGCSPSVRASLLQLFENIHLLRPARLSEASLFQELLQEAAHVDSIPFSLPAKTALSRRSFPEILLHFFSALSVVLFYSSLSRMGSFFRQIPVTGFVDAITGTGKIALTYQLTIWGMRFLLGYGIYVLLDHFLKVGNLRLKCLSQLFLSVGIVHYCPLLTTRPAFFLASHVSEGFHFQVFPFYYFCGCLGFFLFLEFLKVLFYK